VGGVVPVSLGGTGTTTGSITGTGALTFQAGGTNQGVALKPSSQLGTINVGSNTVTGTGSMAVGAVNTVSGPYSSVFGDNNTISGSYNNQDVAVGGNNLLVGDSGGNTVIGQSNALGVNSASTVMLGAGNSDNGASNVLIGTALATSANTVHSNLFGTLLNAGAATTTYGVTILGLGDVNNSSPLINNKDGWTMLGTSSTVPTMSITLSDQTGTPVTGTGRVLIATTTDDGTSKLQVNGATKATQFNSTVATGTAPLVVASTTPVANLAIGGNAGTATKLATARAINGVNFDGSAAIQTATSATSDYATGTWTPTDSSGAGLTFSGSAGDNTYIKIGKMVIATFHLAYPATTNATTAAIGGLPFSAINTPSANFSGPLIGGSGALSYLVAPNNPLFYVISDSGSVALLTNVSLSGTGLSGTVTYQAQ
jgi:hypothetical protein